MLRTPRTATAWSSICPEVSSRSQARPDSRLKSARQTAKAAKLTHDASLTITHRVMPNSSTMTATRPIGCQPRKQARIAGRITANVSAAETATIACTRRKPGIKWPRVGELVFRVNCEVSKKEDDQRQVARVKLLLLHSVTDADERDQGEKEADRHEPALPRGKWPADVGQRDLDIRAPVRHRTSPENCLPG